MIKTWTHAFGLVFLLAFSALANAEDIGVLHLHTLHLQLEPTWKFEVKEKLIQGRGEQGEELLITLYRADPIATEPGKMLKVAQQLSIDFLPDIAIKNGRSVVRAVGPLATSPGKVGFSAGSEKTGFFGGESYFIQYLLASHNTMAYITVAGKGKAEPALQRFDAVMQTQQWDD